MKRCASVERGAGERCEAIWLPELQHFPLNGSLEQLGGIGDPNFLHHVGSMGLNGFDTDFEALCDFLVLKSSPDELKDFLLPGGQRFRASFARENDRISDYGFGSTLGGPGGCRHVHLAPLRVKAIHRLRPATSRAQIDAGLYAAPRAFVNEKRRLTGLMFVVLLY